MLANIQKAVRVSGMKHTTALVNKTKRTFELVEQAVGESLKRDLIARGWDGTAWIGTAKAEGKRKECIALFYRSKGGLFDLAM